MYINLSSPSLYCSVHHIDPNACVLRYTEIRQQSNKINFTHACSIEGK